MSLPRNVVSVDLGNLPRPVALDLLDASAGASVVAYADPSGHARLTLPYSASDTDGTVVKFYVDADEAWLSAKVNGHEVADAGGTTKYVVADPHRSDAAPAVQLEWNADRLNQAAPSGGSTPVREYTFAFAFDTPGLLAGVTAYIPTPDDTLLDAWVEIDTAWNGTTPTADIGSAAALAAFDGYFGLWAGGLVDLTVVDDQSSGWAENPLITTSSSVNRNLSSHVTSRGVPAKFIDATPIKVCVSTNGAPSGSATGATQGAAVLHLLVSTPIVSPA